MCSACVLRAYGCVVCALKECTAGASFQHFLRVGSEPMPPARCPVDYDGGYICHIIWK